MTKSFTLVQLRYFTAVARLENMRAASYELNVTQSTLSAAIGQLVQHRQCLPRVVGAKRDVCRRSADGRADSRSSE